VYKVVWLVRFNEGMAREDAIRHWREVHGEFGRRVPGIVRYTQNVWLAPVGEYEVGQAATAFDGHSEVWFADEQGFRAAMESPEWAEMVADAPNFFDSSTMVGAVLDEYEVVR
jgi:uncharacterized protein (TIGR02118 family)